MCENEEYAWALPDAILTSGNLTLPSVYRLGADICVRHGNVRCNASLRVALTVGQDVSQQRVVPVRRLDEYLRLPFRC